MRAWTYSHSPRCIKFVDPPPPPPPPPHIHSHSEVSLDTFMHCVAPIAVLVVVMLVLVLVLALTPAGDVSCTLSASGGPVTHTYIVDVWWPDDSHLRHCRRLVAR
jgi:hypothetical protein